MGVTFAPGKDFLLMQKEKFYITTAIAYASRKPHFGNTYEIIMSDAFARFQKRLGKDVFLCTGTDEHGQKIEILQTRQAFHPRLTLTALPQK